MYSLMAAASDSQDWDSFSSISGHSKEERKVSLATSDAELAESIRKGDVVAYERLFRLYRPALVDFSARYVRDKSAAEDIVADVFVALWEKRAGWQPRTSIAAYMYGATRNRALNVVRSLTHDARRAARWLGSDGDKPHESPAVEIESTEQHEILWGAIKTLPEPRRSVVILRWQRQLSFAEIAEALDISVSAARKHMERALVTLREIVSTL